MKILKIIYIILMCLVAVGAGFLYLDGFAFDNRLLTLLIILMIGLLNLQSVEDD
jgi:hypothetical protein